MSVRKLSEEEELEIALDIICYGKTARDAAKPFDIYDSSARAIAMRQFEQLLPEVYEQLKGTHKWDLGILLYRRYDRVFNNAVSVRFISKAENITDTFFDKELRNAFKNLRKLVSERGLNKGKDPEYYI